MNQNDYQNLYELCKWLLTCSSTAPERSVSHQTLLIIYMNKDILKKELDKLGVNPNEYSLNGNIESDKIVLYQNYSKWEVFYFDERGGRNCEKVFCNEEDACSYIYELFKSNK